MQKVLFFLSIFVLSLSLQACSSSPTIDGEWKFNSEYTLKITDTPQLIASQIAPLFESLTLTINTTEKKYTMGMKGINHEVPLEIVSKKDNVYTVSVDGTPVEWTLKKDEKGEDILIFKDATTGKDVAFSRVKK